MGKKRILVVDDEPLIRSFLFDALSRNNSDIVLAENGLQAINILKEQNFDIVITDLKMPGKTGMDVLQFVKQQGPKTLVILMTAFASIENAVEAMSLGAFNYLIKPFTIEALDAILLKADEHLSLVQENVFLKAEKMSSFSFIAESPAMKKIAQDIKKISNSTASVFISGESGTGKEVIAQAIHMHSQRRDKPFIKVNCAAIADTLIESEFFGHEKGAFTGANERKQGRFEIADKGTLLLDEVTEIPLNLQPKLLRAIQEQEFERVGATKPIKVDIRFISTTNRSIDEAIKSQIFRDDLYYRLNVIPLFIPPLRNRKEDILPLCNHFLKRYCQENHKPLKKLSPNSIELLTNYTWPGNVRELANVIERTIVMHQTDLIEKEDIFLDLQKSKAANSLPQDLFDRSGYSLPVGLSLAEVEKKLILETLKAQNHNKAKTAKLLGINIRTLRNKLNAYESF